MTLHPTPASPVPEETVRIALAAVPKGNVSVQMRDVLGSIYTDEQFADLIAICGRPVVPPWRLALVTVMQFAEGLLRPPSRRSGAGPHRLEIRTGIGVG
jgi:transposase